jgi:murein DD-endopeptidase MepM/ murein hydrolase activator NlpD
VHHGIDLLSPLGTTIVAVCTGQFRVGRKDPFGIWVQLVCSLPEKLVDNQSTFVSVFYAHLERGPIHWHGLEPREFTPVQRGNPIGYVGKTGNASDPKIQPHLHLEIVVHSSAANAMAEEHPVKEPKTLATASMEANVFTEAQLKNRCLDSLRPNDGIFRRNRRIDPFLMLSCLADRPATEPATSPLNKAERPFSERYNSSMDIDAAQKALILR